MPKATLRSMRHNHDIVPSDLPQTTNPICDVTVEAVATEQSLELMLSELFEKLKHTLAVYSGQTS